MLFLGFLLRTLAAALVVLLYWMALVLFFPYTLPLLLITGGWLPGVLAVQILYPARGPGLWADAARRGY